jgi:hypothetical protein
MQSKRKIVVLTSLVALLTSASALLLALAPPPLVSDGLNSLSATENGTFLDDVFKTHVRARADQWKFIYVHQSTTTAGNARTLSFSPDGLCDHFVIGNGNGCQDGEILMSPRWNNQKPASASPGIEHIEPNCISICLVGDFDQSMPTPTQLRRLTQLVTTLQSQFRIDAENVILLSDTASPSSIGRYFPITAFRDQILP